MANFLFNFLIALVILYSSVAAITFGLDPYIFYRQIFLPFPAFGPDSVAFTKNNPEIAYVSISDGRVLKLCVKSGTFEDFAYTSPIRTKQLCDGNQNAILAATCGKVFGLSVDNVNQILYAVDAYRGLFSIQIPQGGLATPITNTAGGQRIKTSTGIDVDPTTGDVYFVDGSLTFHYSEIPQPGVKIRESTGRLIKYSPKTKEVSVLLSGLYNPTGPAVSPNGTFVLIPLVGNGNIIKYYIKGRKANTTRILLRLSGLVGKIKRASTAGDFWVAVTTRQSAGQQSISKPTAYKFNSFGRVLITKDLSPQYPNTRISVIQQPNPLTIFVGSQLTNYITEYSICKTCL